MLFRHDMFNVMDELDVLLMQPAIFATLAGPPPHEVARICIHVLVNVCIQLQPCFELKNRDEVCRVDQGLIL